jgi:alkylated DNA nucleotide flippase Atl1
MVDDMPDETPPTRGQVVASLKAQVYALVRACPAGKVTTYGWIATQ